MSHSKDKDHKQPEIRRDSELSASDPLNPGPLSGRSSVNGANDSDLQAYLSTSNVEEISPFMYQSPPMNVVVPSHASNVSSSHQVDTRAASRSDGSNESNGTRRVPSMELSPKSVTPSTKSSRSGKRSFFDKIIPRKSSVLPSFESRNNNQNSSSTGANNTGNSSGSSNNYEPHHHRRGAVQQSAQKISANISAFNELIHPPDSLLSAGHRTFIGSHLHTPSRSSASVSRHSLNNNANSSTKNGKDTQGNSTLFDLDTDMSRMAGIVSSELSNESPAQNYLPSGWEAPESWGVQKVPDSQPSKKRDTSRMEITTGISPDSVRRIRVFRPDHTFSTISCPMGITTSELLSVLAKKFFLPTVANHVLGLRVAGRTKVLRSDVRPLYTLFKILLEWGYTEKDNFGEIGSNDINYISQFVVYAIGESVQTFYREFRPVNGYSNVSIRRLDLQNIPVVLFAHGSEIRSLDVSVNLSLNIPSDFIQTCTNLKRLIYRDNKNEIFPKKLCNIPKLMHLDLGGNLIQTLDDVPFDSVSQLDTLILQNNPLKELPDNLLSLSSLRCLNVATCNFTFFPMVICGLHSLSELDISFNEITVIPEGIGDLKNLTKLVLAHNKLSRQFPRSMTNLVNLRELDLRYNNLHDASWATLLLSLEILRLEHNSISSFNYSIPSLKMLRLDYNPLTHFTLPQPHPFLEELSIQRAMLSDLPEDCFKNMPDLKKLVLDRNELVSLPTQLYTLSKLIHLSLKWNRIQEISSDISNFTELQILEVQCNNIRELPQEIWKCSSMIYLNASSNLLEFFPKCPERLSIVSKPVNSLIIDENYTNEPALMKKKLSISSASYAGSDSAESSIGEERGSFSVNTPKRRVSSFSAASVPTAYSLAVSLKSLILADNRLNDECFEQIFLFQNLKVLNLSYNDIMEIPFGALSRFKKVQELYLSHTGLTGSPGDDLETLADLRVLYLNGNRLHTLPAELGKLQDLHILDVGNNFLKYNIANWPYDWNWNFNPNLRYLNFSGNRRLEIKAQHNPNFTLGGERSLSDFSGLKDLRVLGLMDITLTVHSIPDENEDCRIRTTGTTISKYSYGISDTLGNHDHLCMADLVLERFRGKEDEMVFAMFQGAKRPENGSKITKFIQDNLSVILSEELGYVEEHNESVADALRRSLLILAREFGTVVLFMEADPTIVQSLLLKRASSLKVPIKSSDVDEGCMASVLYFRGSTLYLANTGTFCSVIGQSDGSYKALNKRHKPLTTKELESTHKRHGYVDLQGRYNGELETSRALGYFHLIPLPMAGPDIIEYQLSDTDDILIIGSTELWEYIRYETAVDIARTATNPLMAAQKLRDFAIAYGCDKSLMIMVLYLSDKRQRSRTGGTQGSAVPRPSEEEIYTAGKKKRERSALPEDSNLARLGVEVDPPTGHLAMVFTDIKNSTILWELYPIAMRSAIKTHNFVMRRQLRMIGGYEVKTEGDAFMVCFQTATAALLWCFSVQNQLLLEDWPFEIMNSPEGAEVVDAEGNRIYRGLSVRMGIHWGAPVCERDPITKRMDYFGPMVNRASRISAVADGGEIVVSSEMQAEISKLEELVKAEEGPRRYSHEMDEATLESVKRDFSVLSSIGWKAKSLGQFKLKGLENPEYLHLVLPNNLLSRSNKNTGEGSSKDARSVASVLSLETMHKLRMIVLRLEYLVEETSTKRQTTSTKSDVWTYLFSSNTSQAEPYLLPMYSNLITRLEAATTTLFLYRGIEATDHDALKSHRRDGFIEWIKGLLAVPFVLSSEPNLYRKGASFSQEVSEDARRRYAEIFLDVEQMVDEQIDCQESGLIQRARLLQLVPSVGTFFTSLPLKEAFLQCDEKLCISNRRLVSPSFNDVRHVLNTAQLISLAWGDINLRLVTFDGDVTLYDDGCELNEDSPVIPRIIELIRRNVVVGIVTAAGYSNKSGDRYYQRLKGLLKAIVSSTILTDKQKRNGLYVMGGESNFMFVFDGISDELLWIDPAEWMLPEMKTWNYQDINAVLDTAEHFLETCIKNLRLPAEILRKERAVGIIAVDGAKLRREDLEEVVLGVQKRLDFLSVSQRIQFCCFNGGQDVFVDIGDKRLGVKCLQRYLKGISGHETLHVGDQFASLGANDFKARMAASTVWTTSPKETCTLMDELFELKDHPKTVSVKRYQPNLV
ncbi:hypothetical protein CANCADRAFT_2922 [Tortispora caseinolytica NRRL Y-17796]|uniref:IMP-specific 5'-nucleotidase 1 n=1 Tax=Tortispora caseinolytica NRRL Y-17796 TaxID=767744 RepID=A0A1E4THH8_9ASCO|nr:hypothetical protein CANCADRAFT_2922 [Tortispora caseinolytica NRRL Y-17796]